MANIIDRERAEALISEQLTSGILQDMPKQSAFMSLARRLPNMTSKQTRIRVLDELPEAFWVSGDTGFKQTSKAAWDNVYLTAAELAVIVPIPEAVLDDADFDILGEVQPRVIEAIAKKVDSAAIFGNNMPAEWGIGADLITRARQAGNNVAVGSKDWYDLILAEDGAFDKVEKEGYAVNGAIGALGMKAKLRGLRTSDGLPIFNNTMQGATQYALDGEPLYFMDNGAFDTSAAQLVVGDFSQAVYAIRQDITVKILDQAIIQNPITKEIVYNLAQQDMIALRVVFRMGIAFPTYATAVDGSRTSFPFAYVEPGTPLVTKTATFTVKDNATDSAIEGAIVDVAGARIVTDASGVAVFNLRNGEYNATIKADGYKKMSETVTVNGSNTTKTVKLKAN